jgi:hypothetical protein
VAWFNAQAERSTDSLQLFYPASENETNLIPATSNKKIALYHGEILQGRVTSHQAITLPQISSFSVLFTHLNTSLNGMSAKDPGKEVGRDPML